VDESRRPHIIHRLPPGNRVARIIQVRLRGRWCGEAIASCLNQQETIEASSGSVYKVLKESNLITRTYKPRRQRTYVRFTRQHSDSLWQTEIKYYGNRYLIAFLDDCSCYVPGTILCKHATTRRILRLLDEILSQGRIPRQILSDHDAHFHSEDGGSQFTAYLEVHAIEHIVSSIGKPLTQGKIERFFQTFELCYPRSNDMTEFLEHTTMSDGIEA